MIFLQWVPSFQKVFKSGGRQSFQVVQIIVFIYGLFIVIPLFQRGPLLVSLSGPIDGFLTCLKNHMI